MNSYSFVKLNFFVPFLLMSIIIMMIKIIIFHYSDICTVSVNRHESNTRFKTSGQTAL